MLWFWAPWCPTCVAQAPHVARIAADYAGRANVVGGAGMDRVQAMNEFVALPKVSGFPHLADEQGLLWKRFGVTAQSTYVVLDTAGTVVKDGHLEPEQLRAELDRLVGKA
jgi:thiol-disulfide isomerase/thioredoxin